MNPQNTTELEAEIRKAVEGAIEKDISKIALNDDLKEKMNVDSMTALEIIAAVEDRFKIRIQEQDFPKTTTLQSVIDVVARYLEKKNKK